MTPVPPSAALAELLRLLSAHDDLLLPAPRLWVGLSGGADSTALLLALKHSPYAERVVACHVDHGLQQASAQWHEHCVALCRRLEIPLECLRAADSSDWPPTGNLEAWARQVRYRHWRSRLGSGDVLLLGHHRDDQTETVALRLLQGRLPLPMPAARPLAPLDETRWLLRPFLAVGGDALRDALSGMGYRWIEDPTNADPRVLRSRVRRHVLPALRADTRTSARSSHAAASWDQALQRCGELTLRMVDSLKPCIKRSGATVGEVGRFPARLAAYPHALQSGVTHCGVPMTVRQALACKRQFGEGQNVQGRPRSRPIATLQEAAPEAGGAVQLWCDGTDLVVWREPECVRLSVTLSADGAAEVGLAHGRLLLRGPAAMALEVRPRQVGDRLAGHHASRSVRDRLRSLGIPRWARPSYPLIFAAPCNDAPQEGAAQGGLAGTVLSVPHPVSTFDSAVTAQRFARTDAASVAAVFLAN